MDNTRNHNFTRAQLKKARRSFKVGDVVTWGSGEWSHRIVAVQSRGVVVDASSAGWKSRWFVAFDGNIRNGPHHPDGGCNVRHSSDPPDIQKKP